MGSSSEPDMIPMGLIPGPLLVPVLWAWETKPRNTQRKQFQSKWVPTQKLPCLESDYLIMGNHPWNQTEPTILIKIGTHLKISILGR